MAEYNHEITPGRIVVGLTMIVIEVAFKVVAAPFLFVAWAQDKIKPLPTAQKHGTRRPLWMKNG